MHFWNKRKKKTYIENKRQTDMKFRSIGNTKRRIHYALKSIVKPFYTKCISRIVFETYKKWIKHQMMPEMNLSKLETDHVKLICLFNVSKDV